MPPRAAPAAQSVTKTSAVRGAKKVSASPLATSRTLAVDTIRQPDVKVPCPLCIEELDETDRDFYPCPCGYQVCLFCYGQIKEKCNSQCPGCRREYGEPVEAPILKQFSDERAAVGVAARLSTVAQRTAVNGVPQSAHQPWAGTSGGATRAAAAAAAALTPASSKLPHQRAAPPDATSASMSRGGSLGGGRHEDAALTAALPSGATWAAAAVGNAARHAPAASAAAGVSSDRIHALLPLSRPTEDESAWPSLSDSTLTNAVATMRRPNRQDHSQHGCRSPETADSDVSRCHSSSPSSSDLTPLDSLSSSSQDLGLLQAHMLPPPHEMGNDMRARASRKAPPPGFGAVAPVLSSTSCSGPTQQDPSVAGPPLAKYQPIQPPPQHAGMSGMASKRPCPTTYSMWSGLPGIEVNFLQSFGPCHIIGAYPCNPPSSYQQGCAGAKPPPPGFGPSPYAADFGPRSGLTLCQMLNGAMQGSRQFGSSLANLAQPPGMTV